MLSSSESSKVCCSFFLLLVSFLLRFEFFLWIHDVHQFDLHYFALTAKFSRDWRWVALKQIQQTFNCEWKSKGCWTNWTNSVLNQNRISTLRNLNSIVRWQNCFMTDSISWITDLTLVFACLKDDFSFQSHHTESTYKHKKNIFRFPSASPSPPPIALVCFIPVVDCFQTHPLNPENKFLVSGLLSCRILQDT